VSGFELPPAPASEAGRVKAWLEPVTIETYAPMAPDKNPMFLENRVYQGSSGRVYPLPFTDRIATQASERIWQATHLENEYLRVMILPDIGGRIHVGLDKTNGYDFFYRQNVIKPALVGLAGPWISGGVEFNWPQHHRPATFMPVQVHIELHDDGSRTVWCSDHDPMSRLKGMHGVRLHPGKAYVEVKVRLYNRTPFVQTFLWWANAAARVHEAYQSFFPPDVHYVADHAKRATSTFPLCGGSYYGVDYGRRALSEVPAQQRPAQFIPPGTYAPNDLSWYANIPVPTSYMALGSSEDFFGGYDHKREAGFVHVANRHISPGKKQWTWGNHEFGYAWDRNLTDEDGPYIELMSGVYTDNQPDFSFLAPGETRTFSQFWYPIQKIGPVQKANVDGALSLTASPGAVRIGLCVTRSFPNAQLRLEHRGETVQHWCADLIPGQPLMRDIALPAGAHETDLRFVFETAGGREVLAYARQPAKDTVIPEPATEPASPDKIKGNEELYLTGLHLEQYRHATREAELYWKEALRRDPDDSRCNNAMGLWHLRRGEFEAAISHFQRATARLTMRNPNPRDGEPFYNLGLALRYSGREEEAYDAFYKATWNYAWSSAAYQALAELDTRRADWKAALEHLRRSLRTNAEDLNARNLVAIVLRKLQRDTEADELLRETLAFDPLDQWAAYLSGKRLTCDNPVRLDIAFDFGQAGLYQEALELLKTANLQARDGSLPMVFYTLGFFELQLGREGEARNWLRKASEATPDYCFPSRLEEMVILETAIELNASDARAPYYLGNLLYDRRRHREAIEYWERAAELDPVFPTAWRNLGIGYYNVADDASQAKAAFDKAFAANPRDGRVLYERDQLAKRIGIPPEERLRELEKYSEIVLARDDLSVELATLYNQTGKHELALELLTSRRYQPWEGGEGLVLTQYVRTQLARGRDSLEQGDAHRAKEVFEAVLTIPENLGEARHPLSNASDIHYWLGMACQAAGDESDALSWWKKAAESAGDFQEMSVTRFSEMTYYQAMALRRLGDNERADDLLNQLEEYAQRLARSEPKIEYFATSLPTMLLFTDDLKTRKAISADFLKAQASLGVGKSRRAIRLVKQILAKDPSHSLASDLLRSIPVERKLQGAAQVFA
jgi:tetratricopeptide (TPR) repeat protein